jgi:uncharacterized protein (TIGR03118 family)
MKHVCTVTLSLMVGVGIVASTAETAWAGSFIQFDLVSDIPGMATVTDPNLMNPWGVSFSSTSPMWVSDQGANVSTLYAITAAGVSKVGLTVNIPTTPTGPQGPTGQVNNSTTAFKVGGSPANFIFADLNGTISAWNGSAGTTAQVMQTVPGAVYTGLAQGTSAAGPVLYAANGAQNRIDVFDGSFSPISLGPNAFVDTNPALAGLVPFNVERIGSLIYVTYALPGRAAQISAPEGSGAVAVFDMNGNLIDTLITGSKLASPWGMAMAPAGFGDFGGDLLVGNFSYPFSEINAFNPSTGAYLGTIMDANGNPIINSGLWSLTFGNGGSGGLPNTLYFTAGINDERDGLVGAIDPVPEPGTWLLVGAGSMWLRRWRRRRAAPTMESR